MCVRVATTNHCNSIEGIKGIQGIESIESIEGIEGIGSMDSKKRKHPFLSMRPFYGQHCLDDSRELPDLSSSKLESESKKRDSLIWLASERKRERDKGCINNPKSQC